MANLGVNYKEAGRVAEAIPLLEEAYQASKKIPHPWLGRHCSCSTPTPRRARTPSSPRRVKLIDEMLTDARKTLPKDSPQLAGMLAQFGMSLLEMKGYAEAEPLLRECLAIREKIAARRLDHVQHAVDARRSAARPEEVRRRRAAACSRATRG